MSCRTDRRSFLLGAVGAALAGGIGLGLNARRSVAAATAFARQPLTDELALWQGAGGNVLALSGTDGVLLVDGGSREHSAALLRQVQAGGRPVGLLVNTHWHWEHTGSNEALGRRGVPILAHENTKLWLQRPVDVPWQGRRYPASPAAAWPTRTFHTTGALTFGGEELAYGHLGQAHTDGDLYVHFRRANVLAVGDVVAAGHYPVMDWASGGWIGGLLEASAQLLKLADGQTRIVAGTGGILTRAQLQAQHDMLEVLKERIWQLMRKGLSDVDIVAAQPTKEYDADRGDPRQFLLSADKGLWGHVREQRGVV